MPYTSSKPPLPWTTEELRERIPGWGFDLDPADRPAWPKELPVDGVDDQFPERQEVDGFRERSVEHAFVTPVFGTSVPLRGLSGIVRRVAYARFSEGRAAHWLLLLAGDRLDAGESHLRAVLSGRPDSALLATGLRSELTHGGLSSRWGRRRVDVRHQWMDPFVVAAPWVASGAVAWRVTSGVRRRLKRPAVD